MTTRIILASASPFRLAMLHNAGIETEANPSRIDERAVEEAIGDAAISPENLAWILAEAKAEEVSERFPGALVIGSDQTLSLGDEVLHKASDMEEARRRLLKLSGKTHHLNSAVVLARDGKALWGHVSVARMTMRKLDPGFVGRYLSRVGDQVLRSVGVYQIEGEGIQLFDAIEGDHFTIVGMPLLELIAELRRLGAIDG
ncbi:Maf-like protein [Mesorhizobium australicum]|uniref:7-methyl-GTP pyrophosphatase n=1 Tax=Mesorhizobium australicum TaxID=536018 RepID=A0A1X7MW02_9HYPH|nr:Maf-like protein [Mesorhizobium australicum]SMH28331.1 septum formation protein [Mesorhizobium australicum]